MLGESEGTTGDATIEEIGRRRTFTRTLWLAIVLLLVQQPMAAAVRDSMGAADACAIPGRLSLLVDGGFIAAYIYSAYRAYKYVRFLRRPGWRPVALVGACLVWLAGLLDAVENVRLWRALDGGPGACSGLSTGWFSWLMRGVWVVGVLILAVSLFLTSRYGQRKVLKKDVGPAAVTFNRVPDPGPDAGRLVICCSGGGIRSASFCLGALQLLRERGLYDKASTVIGVSGGGYMAAAFHILRRNCIDPFSPGSPELSRLRRQTRYLLQGGRAMFRAALSVLFGLVVNLLLIGIVLRAVAWVLGWFLADQQVVERVGQEIQVHWRPGGSWWFLGLSVSLLVLGIVLFMLEKIWDRWALMPDPVRSALTGVGGLALVAGTPVALLLLGVPGGLYLLTKLPGTDNPEQPSLPKALLDLVDPTKQGLASFTALVIALLGLGRTVWTGLSSESKDPSQSGLRSRLIAFARNKLAPWLGTTIILVAAVVVLLRWTGGYATDPSYQQDWSVAWVLVGIAVAIKLLTDANRTSLHPFYRERLSRAFLVTRQDNGAAVSLDYSLRLRYSEWARPREAGPQLVVAAVANVADADFVPSQRDCVPFVFDPDQIGIVGDRSLPYGGRRPTPDYEREADALKREVTVPAAMAISGAALSPLTGRVNSRTRPVRLLLAVLNARLGVWLPNPYWNNRPEGPSFPEPTSRWGHVRRYVGSVIDKPGPYRLLREAIGTPSMYDRRIYVTDGGHYDNLGLVEALRREPAQVIVIDASNDPEDRFNALGEAIATARMDHGIRIDLDPAPMVRGDTTRADRAWAYGVATHPLKEGADKQYKTEIFFLKAVLAGSVSWDLEQYAAGHADFPRRSTGDQFYNEWDFEAYRDLGYVLAESLLDHQRVSARLEDVWVPPGAAADPCP